MRFKHIIAACESSFVTKAFKQYVETRAANMETVINGIQGAITADTQSDLDLIKSQVGSDILNSHIWLFNKPVKVNDLLTYINDHVNIAIDGVEVEGEDRYYGPLDFSLSELIGVDKNFSEGINDLKEQFATASAIQMGCESYLNTALTTITDRLNYFKSRMTEKFSDAAMNSVVFIQNMKSALLKSVNCSDFMSTVSNMLGVKRAAEITSSESLDDFLEEEQNKGYDGSAPIFSLAIKVPVLAEVWFAVKSIGSSIVNFFNKVGDGISDLRQKAAYATIHPIDVYCVNDEGNNTFDQLFWRGNETFVGDFRSLNLTQDDANYLFDWLLDNLNIWLQIDTHFANIYFKITGAYAPDQANPDVLHVDYSYLVQPKTNHLRDTFSFGYYANEGPYGDEGDGVITDLSNEIYSMVLQSEALGLPASAEAEKSFVNNTFENLLIANQIAALTATDAGYIDAVTFPSVGLVTDGVDFVNNADVFYVATGEPSDGGNIDFAADFSYANAGNILKMLIPAFLTAIVSQHKDGVTFDNFFPYVKGEVDLLAGKWGIKTDEVNQAAATKFYTNVITITAATIAAIYLGIKMTKLVQNIKFKRIAYIQDINSRLANGDSLTLIEQLKYSKYARKLGILGAITSGLNTGSGFSNDFDSGPKEIMNQIVLLIPGLK